MPIAFDASSTSQVAVASSLTYSHTTSGSDRFLKVGVSVNTSTLSSVTYAGTDVGAIAEVNVGGGHRAYMRGLVAPATGANNVVVTTAALSNITSTAESYTGVDQVTPNDTAATASGNSTAPSVNVSSATDDLVIDTVEDTGSGTLAADASQTQRQSNSGGGNGTRCGSSEEAGAATVTMSWTKGTSTVWGIIGVSINPAAEGEPAPPQVGQPFHRRFWGIPGHAGYSIGGHTN